MSDFDHCLRPVLTERVVQLLQRGRSINLIGGENAERRRLLGDIQQMTFPETTILPVNMKKYRHTYDGLLRELWTLLGRDGDKPDNISALIERYEEQDGRLFILMQNFDALLGTPDLDPRYNVTFYDALNYVKNRPNIALACATQQPHDQSVVFVEGKPLRTSWIDLEPVRLPALTHTEIVLEVKRRLPDMYMQERSAVIDALREHETPYKLLSYLSEKYLNRENAELVFQKRLKLWLKQFQVDAKNHLFSKKGGLTARQELSAWSGLSGISSLKGILVVLGKLLKLLSEILENTAQKRNKHDSE